MKRTVCFLFLLADFTAPTCGQLGNDNFVDFSASVTEVLLERQGAWREALGRKDPDYKLSALAIKQTNLMAHSVSSAESFGKKLTRGGW